MLPRPWQEIQRRFGLWDTEKASVDNFQDLIPPEWEAMFQSSRSQAILGEWIGVFPGALTDEPSVLFQTIPECRPPLSETAIRIDIPTSCPKFMVGTQSRGLIPLDGPSHSMTEYYGSTARVWVISTPSTSKPRAYRRHKYLAPISRLTFDPGRWQWQNGAAFFAYSAVQGRKLCRPRQELSLPISEKWIGLVPANFSPNWQEVWDHHRPRKEAAFL